jgi:inhibitor of cysteine peptidase
MKHTILVLLLTIVFLSTFTACVLEPQSSPEYDGDVKKFSSEAELNTFLEQQSEGSYYGGIALGNARMAVDAVAMDSVEESVAIPESAKSIDMNAGEDFSTTNIQVQGVDEPDIVKTDGESIYYVTNDRLYIIDANAEDLDIVAELEIENGYTREMFLANDKVILLGTEYDDRPQPLMDDVAVARIAPGIWYPRTNMASVRIYDISDKEEPELEEKITLEGNYADARMIDGFVYVIFNKYTGNSFVPPIIYSNAGTKEIEATDVSYFDIYDSSYQLSIVLAVDLEDNSYSEETFLKGNSQNIYVSENNIYLTGRKQIPYYAEQQRIIEEVFKAVLPQQIVGDIERIQSYDIRESTKIQEIQYVVEQYFNSLDEEQVQELMEQTEDDIEEIQSDLQRERDTTVIHRIAIDEDSIEHKASGEIPGCPLNQFSMDERDGYFRIATTQGNSWSENNPSSNNLYVLDMDLDIVGEIEDIAPQERIYSVRFMQDKAYMVTFRNIDPLFVIDLADPENPEILGKLKIPGYSDYLHPYDENHIIGIGKETEVDEKNERAFQQGVKLALFDVSDVENPKEIAKIEIGDRGSDSEALRNHKAFLFDKERNLLVLPISVAEVEEEDEETLWRAWGSTVFQGAYVYTLTPEDGFDLQGTITHFTEDDIEKSGYWFDYNKRITRTLFIGDSLYTLSNQIIQTHTLDDIEFEDELVLFEQESDKDVYYIE